MNNRIEWIDSLRGFAIFLVVYYHVIWAGIGYKDSVSCSIISTFFMHIFFFISGYLGCIKSNESIRTYPQYIYKKIRTLLIPTIMIVCAGFLYLDFTVRGILMDLFKGGFWFTLCLFEMLLLHYLIQIFLNLLKKESYKIIIGSIISLMFYYFAFHISIWMPCTIFISLKLVLIYYPAMMLGYIIKNFILHGKSSFLYSKYIILFLIVISIYPTLEIKQHGVQIFYNIIISLARVLLIYICFTFYTIKKQTILYKFINYIGKYSLEIYFLHYFVFISVPDAIKYLSPNVKFINEQVQFISLLFREFVIAFPITVIIILTCLGINKLLSMSSIIQALFFGKYKR